MFRNTIKPICLSIITRNMSRKMSSLLGLSKRLNIFINKDDNKQAIILDKIDDAKYELIKPYTKDNQIIVMSKRMKSYENIYYAYVKRGISRNNINNVISILGEDEKDKKYIYKVYDIDKTIPTYYYKMNSPLASNIYCPKHFIVMDNHFDIEKFRQEIKYFNHFNNAHYYMFINQDEDYKKQLGFLRSLKMMDYDSKYRDIELLQLVIEQAFNDLNRQYRK